MEILSSVVGKIVELTIEPIRRQLSYLCFIRENIEKLKGHIEMLKETRETVRRMVYDARRNAEDIKPGVQSWLTKVDAIIERSELILTNEGQLCLNLVQRHQLSRKAVKMANEVIEMKNEGNFDRVSFGVAKYESSLTKTSYFFNFESRKSTKEQIIDALMNDNVNKIGIYGMGGVGKTMIVKEILREVMEKKLFDEAVISTISKTLDLKRIQGEIAEKLGLKLEEDTIEGRALKLRKRLMIEKRSLIVFDDIWAPFDLETIGIPSDVDHKGCKILFTSRDKHTLANDMCIDSNFEIKVLQKNEAWSLFKTIVGETIETIDLKSIAIQILRECANLPIAIITVAKALRNKPTSVWNDALNQLSKPASMNIKGMNEKVYASLKLSYDQLECEEAKMLLLLCSMFPEDSLIDVQHLHIYAMAFDILHGVDTMAQRRHRITKLVDDLISSCLLLKYVSVYGTPIYMNDQVQMHDLVRDVAILIASKDNHIRTLSYAKNSKEWEEDEVSGNHTAMFLDVKVCQSLPEKLMLPKIQLLILVGRKPFVVQELPVIFFEEMKELKVLELQSMKISFLSRSLDSFTNIRSLHLFDAKIENIDMIGQLNKLEVLSFRGSNITQIPMAISQLTQLKVLDLSSCHQLKVILPNILSKLTKLEELNLNTYNGWEGEELNRERKNASVSELKNLSALSTLCLCIKDEEVLTKEMLSMKLNLETFDISIGFPHELTNDHHKIIRKKLCLKIKSDLGMNDWVKMLMNMSEKLHLEGAFSAKVFRIGLDENETSLVKYLDLYNIDGLEHVIHEQKYPFRKTLVNLVHLYARNLKNLECIIHGHDRKYPFNKLKFVNVKGCKKLGSLFFNCIVDDLLNLEKIEIKNCEMMEVISVMANEEATNKFEFTHLRILRLCNLPQLLTFNFKIEKGGTSNRINIDSFFTDEVSLPNLEELRIEHANNLKIQICGNVPFSNSFSKLLKVYIDSCNNLERVFSWKIMCLLTCLESIKIKNCKLLEEIFEVQEANVTNGSGALLPRLRKLKLYNLPNLRYVWSEDPSEFQIFKNMETLSIHQCPKLRNKCITEVLPQLKYLDIELSRMEAILEKEKCMSTSKVETIEPKDGFDWFSKLKSLKLQGTLDYNITRLPTEIVQILPFLETFEVKNALIEEIILHERLIRVQERHHECARSELLRTLRLFKLPKLKHWWNEFSDNTSVHHLIYLHISECGVLNSLVPSSVSLRNFRILRVHSCHRLTHLLNPYVARTLVQLEVLHLVHCKTMTTVVDVGGVEEENEEIVFNKLHTLLLRKLPKLTSFHSGRCNIKFPRLNNVEIDGCPEMTVFSFGTVSTPHLESESVRLYNDYAQFDIKVSNDLIVKDFNVIIQQIWENNFDTSIPLLFAEKNFEENQDDRSYMWRKRNFFVDSIHFYDTVHRKGFEKLFKRREASDCKATDCVCLASNPG